MPIGVLGVGRLARGAHGDQREDARDHVHDRVDRLAQDAQASRQQADDELAQHEGDSDKDRNQRDQHRPAPESCHSANSTGLLYLPT